MQHGMLWAALMADGGRRDGSAEGWLLPAPFLLPKVPPLLGALNWALPHLAQWPGESFGPPEQATGLGKPLV